MRLASFATDSGTSWGVLGSDVVHDVGAVGPNSLRQALAEAPATFTSQVDRLVEQAPVLTLSAVRLLPPVPDALKVLCVGLNYADHIQEMGRQTPDFPTIFTRFNDSLVGDGAALLAPRNSVRYDFEGELAVVIGRGGRHIAAADALDHVLGYTMMNDGSIRDYQRHTTQFTAGKNFPSSGSLGPWIVTAEEFGPVGSQRLQTTVNGVVVQDSTLDQLVFGVSELIAYISEWTELSPGDVIATGTPGGVGDGRSPALYLFPGDVVTVAVEGLGAMTNTVAEDL